MRYPIATMQELHDLMPIEDDFDALWGKFGHLSEKERDEEFRQNRRDYHRALRTWTRLIRDIANAFADADPSFDLEGFIAACEGKVTQTG
jgi:hypothetical protein